MQSAQPALSELRAKKDQKHLATVVGSLTQAMLLLSGAVSVVIMATNHGFVNTWVGPSQYLGFIVTAAMLIEMMLRHWNVTTVYSLFACGRQRQISIASVTEGILSNAISIGLILLIGPLGAVLGSIAAVVLVSLPWNLYVLSRELQCSVGDLLRPLSGWAVRFVPLLALAAVAGEFFVPRNYFATAGVAAGALAVYALAQWPVVLRSQWIGHIRQQIEGVLGFFGKRAPQAA